MKTKLKISQTVSGMEKISIDLHPEIQLNGLTNRLEVIYHLITFITGIFLFLTSLFLLNKINRMFSGREAFRAKGLLSSDDQNSHIVFRYF